MYIDDIDNPTVCFDFNYLIAIENNRLDFTNGANRFLDVEQMYDIINTWQNSQPEVAVLPRKNGVLVLDTFKVVFICPDFVETVDGTPYKLQKDEIKEIIRVKNQAHNAVDDGSYFRVETTDSKKHEQIVKQLQPHEDPEVKNFRKSLNNMNIFNEGEN